MSILSEKSCNYQKNGFSAVDSDNDLRCDCFPKYVLSGFLYPTFDQYRDVSLKSGFDHISTGVGTVGQFDKEVRLFAVAYAGENLKSGEYRKYLLIYGR